MENLNKSKFNPFFSDAFAADGFLMTKEEIAQKDFAIMFSTQLQRFLFFDKICSKSSAAELSYEGKGKNY